MKSQGFFLTGFAAVVFLAASTAGAADLLGYWPLDETLSPPTHPGYFAADMSYNGMTGVYQRGVTVGVPGALPETGPAMDCDGVDDEIFLGNPASLAGIGNDFTLAAWIYPRVDDVGTQRFFSSSAYNGGGFGWGLYNHDFKFTVYGVKDYFMPAASMPLDAWSHVAVTFEQDAWYHIAMTLEDDGIDNGKSVLTYYCTPYGETEAIQLGDPILIEDPKPFDDGDGGRIWIGEMQPGLHVLRGDIDELRWSNTVRTDFNLYESFGAPDLPGDLNGDGFVGSADLDMVRGNWGEVVAPGTLGDANNDGFVNSGDLDIVRGNWGSSLPASVPEPHAVLFIALAALFLGTRRR